MRILFVHNFYQLEGGEDAVFKNEIELLKIKNEILEYTVNNDSINSLSGRILVFFRVVFSFKAYREFKQYLVLHNPDVVHVHNYFPLLSPSIFYACKKNNIPVIHTLHNYRAVCPTALLMHSGEINERSIKGTSWWAVTQKVYRGSFIGTLVLATMVELHKWLGTWKTKVNYYVALTEFSKQKYIEAGWPEYKICIKPNFIDDPFSGAKAEVENRDYALFVGRLSEEKGIDILLDGWKGITSNLKIVGDGPLREYVVSKTSKGVEYLGLKDKAGVLNLIKNADFIIMPSTWYETFGMVIIEAFACGTPVIVSKLGSLQIIVEDGMTGLHFEAGNAKDLAEKAQWLIDNPQRAREMGQNARNEYLAKYTPEKNYEMLMGIYQQAIDEAE
jgi:glycosyltransferase involved in cell wall biosynthesis